LTHTLILKAAHFAAQKHRTQRRKDERKQRQIEHAKKLSKGAALIKLGDKISNVTDVTDNPPADWDINRRREYLDWAEKVIENCPQVNKRMENNFQEVVNNGRKQLV